MPTHIAVVMGGLSSEREVSLSSGKGVCQALKHLGYQVTPLDMGRDIAKHLEQLKPDIVFNALHGPYGEDGCLPGLLEIIGIPYTHSGVMASALSLDKLVSKRLVRSLGILSPQERVIHRLENIINDPLPRPYVIKPLNEGSSIGVILVFKEDDFSFANYTWPYGDTILVEPYIKGKEVQVAVVGNKAIGAIEIKPKGRFYDYEAKYTAGRAQHIMPASLSSSAYKMILEKAEIIHHFFHCRGISRADFLVDPEEQLYFLEINTHPGMTPLSLVPEIAAYIGMSFEQLVEQIIKEARCDLKPFAKKEIKATQQA